MPLNHKHKQFDRTVGFVLLIVAVIHLLQALGEWDIFVGEYNISLFISWIVFFGALYLAYSAFKLSE